MSAGWVPRAGRVGAALALVLAGMSGAAAQTVPAPAPVETAPLAPPPVAVPPAPGAPPASAAPVVPPPMSPPPPAAAAPPSPAGPPAATITQSPPPGAAPVPPPPAVAVARPTLIPEPGDASNADEVVLPARPVLVLSGASRWEEGLTNLRAAFARLEAELARGGIAPAGRPIAVFTETTDDTFRFDAMMPVGATPSPAPALGPDLRFGTTPSGKAYRFVHRGPYDDIDSTYETITAYLDAKDVVAKDAFIEEYLDDIADPADPGLGINIFVQPR